MKPKTTLIIILIIGLIFTILVTPIEANLTKHKLGWMYEVNLKEYLIFTFSLVLGIMVGKKLK